ncbi:MAG: ImmA/IrrE family metallo-endopeptidase [Ignavibacteria bacterium]|nr:ImmA/IrrE family metallo-endopeptidase [Ignavibacteria bacterium]
MENSVKIGNIFERKVYKLLEDELKNNRLFVNPNYCKLYHKKGYFSKDRQSNIIVDISMEVFLPGANEYSLLIIVECKNYKHSVPVDDVEEFFAKIQQISGANIKGIVVTTNSFQQGALNFSKSKGLGLIRILDENKLKWVLKRAVTGLITYEEIEKSKSNIYDGLITENYSNNQIDFLSFVNEQYSYSAHQFFEYLIKDDINSFGDENAEELICQPGDNLTFVPFVEKEVIEKYSQDILRSIKYQSGIVSIRDISDYLEARDGIKFNYCDSLGYDELGFEILGKISFEPTMIFISKKANENKHREKFTIAHEIGHHILNHMQFMNGEYYAENDFENNNFDVIELEDIKRIEWQANYFASNLLLPKTSIIHELCKILIEDDIRDKGYGALFVDRQECNINNYYKVTNKLKLKFDVSRKAISFRLKNLGLLIDSRDKQT